MSQYRKGGDVGCRLLHHFLPKTCGPRMSQAPVAQNSVGCPTGDGRPVTWCGRRTRTGTSSAWATSSHTGDPARCPSAQLPCLHAALGLPLQSLLACFLWISFHLTSPCPVPLPAHILSSTAFGLCRLQDMPGSGDHGGRDSCLAALCLLPCVLSTLLQLWVTGHVLL